MLSARESLTHVNVERAIQRTFNIKKRSLLDNRERSFANAIVGSGVEIGGIAIASQEAQELNDILKTEGHTFRYFFAPNGRWSVLNINKIKVQWASRVQQIRKDARYWNIVPGHWSQDGKVFYPDMLSEHVQVMITPTKAAQAQAQAHGYILLPYKSYKICTDISDLVPKVRFDQWELECVQPKSLSTISVNRQGIYINRKYREKTEDAVENACYMECPAYELSIYYQGQLIHMVFLSP